MPVTVLAGLRDITATGPKVAIVILNWNDGAATLDCLAALGSTGYANRIVIVVDNASADGSVQRIAALGAAEIVCNTANLGFTGGVNAGIRHAMASKRSRNENIAMISDLLVFLVLGAYAGLVAVQ